MQNFETIFQRAANRHGGEDANSLLIASFNNISTSLETKIRILR